MKVIVNNLAESAWKAGEGAQFGSPIDHSMRVGLLGSGLKGAAHRAESCMGWVWRQWLSGASKTQIAVAVEPFVERGLEMRRLSKSYHKLPFHDLYLLHCSIFGSNAAQLARVVNEVTGSEGDKGEQPLNNGELYAAAWTGMMKWWILGDHQKAAQESELIWGARREHGVLAAAKPLVTPWLKRDWKKFDQCQRKDFDKLWARARKDRWTVRSESPTEIVVTTERYQITHMWCWAHCGMALLAHRQGVDVVTDPFWFPSAALADVGNGMQ